MRQFNVLVEGDIDEAVAIKLLAHAGLGVNKVYGKTGKSDILKNLRKYNEAARLSDWLVLLDLDNDACAPEFLRSVSAPSRGMVLRLAVRQVESWLMADREEFSKFFGVPQSKIPFQVELEPHAKKALVACVAHSKKTNIRADMLPPAGSHGLVGPLYTPTLQEYIRCRWRPAVAATNCDSLCRAIRRLSERSRAGQAGEPGPRVHS